MRKELWFGLSLMGLIVLAVVALMPWGSLTTGHLGLLMLALVVVAIMLGFPTAFTLMGMGMIFALFAYWSRDPGKAVGFTLDLMVQRTYAVMSNDVLISIPLFVFMGYLVERANLISKLFKSLQLALVRLPGSLAVATLFTCAVFATATGIVGAVVTLMGLLALPAMMRSGYDVRISAGVITAGGCLGILIPPSVMLIVYGATAGVSVVKLYAGAFFPGLMLAGLYILYVIVLAKIKPTLMPALSEEERRVDLGPLLQTLRDHFGSNALAAMVRALKGTKNIGVPMQALIKEFLILLIPAMFCAGLLALLYLAASPSPENTQGAVASQVTGVTSQSGSTLAEPPSSTSSTGLAEPPSSASSTGLAEPPSSTSSTGLAEPANTTKSSTGLAEAGDGQQTGIKPQSASTHELPLWYKLTAAVMLSFLALLYWRLTMVRLEVFKMLLASFFPLAFLILSVLGTIVFGLATPTEAAAVGSLGGFLLAFAYKQLNLDVVRESVFLTAKTSAMVCWLFVGSSIFSAAFALLGGQELIESWVLSLGLSKIQFLLLSQVIIFLLGWPLEWTEIIVIFMPIFIPLLAKFGVDPLFFGLLVALNLQTAFLSPPVAMAAFYLKGVAPPEVSLNQIFAGMMPFMAIQVFALFLLYVFPEIGLWLPEYMYK
ncbi:MAG: TRAP transporter large permease subunit [Betaproteobacteria bacterium]|nr:TRAP transporter large permease subunit [Betaproteobacteria bacterium]NCZ98356.1 TRAP transporter large permease subunit [Betaproteobacteria bacterium]NDD75835.1 TRAP transporter large permease subunit [Betaproteobacteria bacterium]NDG17396.1 TRAP transporter large permease subunit [Betaproteobacteria bacterium]